MTTGLHEQFTRNYRVESVGNRRFGFVVGGLLLLFGCIRTYLHGDVGWFGASLAGVGLILLVAAALKPEALEPVNRAWTKLGLFLHKVTNPLFLGAMFILAIVPTGLIMRVFGSDPMGRRRHGRETYWIKRSKGGSTTDSLGQPF